LRLCHLEAFWPTLSRISPTDVCVYAVATPGLGSYWGHWITTAHSPDQRMSF